MSEGGETNAATWWGGWVQSAKEKSLSVLNVVKHDLTEFTTVMQEDGTKVASAVKEKLTHENASAASEKVKHGVTSLLGGLSKVLVVKPDDEYQPARIVDGEAVVFDRAKARLHAIQIDPSTYTSELTLDNKYEEWLASSFNLEEMKGDISDLLVSNTEVRALYTQLVPFTVSNVDFWRRYFYRKHILEEDETRRFELMKRADITQEKSDLGWDEDDDVTTDSRNLTSNLAAKRVAMEAKADVDPAVDVKTNVPVEAKTPIDGETADLSSGDAKKDAVSVEPNFLHNLGQLESPADLNLDQSNSLTGLSKSLESQQSLPDEDTVVSTATSDGVSIEDSFQPSQEFDELTDSAPAHIMQESGDDLLERLATVKVKSSESSHSSVPSLGGWSTLSDMRMAEDDGLKVDTKQEDQVEIELAQGPRTPSSDENSNAKESSNDDWEKDFDVEVTEEDLRTAREAVKKTVLSASNTGGNGKDEDWEEW